MTSSLSLMVNRVVLVVHPSARSLIEKEIEKLPLPLEIICVEQSHPVGMADAVHRGISQVTTEFAWIIWGDQPFLRPRTLGQISRQMERGDLSGVIPLIPREKPYVHYQADTTDRLIAVLQRREMEILPESGLSDVGCFAFHTDSLRKILMDSSARKGGVTGEWNLLPEFPKLESEKKGLGFVRFGAEDPECISINTPEEAAFAENWARAHPDFALTLGRRQA